MPKKTESVYALKKRIKELERENYLLRDDRAAYRSVCDGIFNQLAACNIAQYVPPMQIMKALKPLMMRTKVY